MIIFNLLVSVILGVCGTIIVGRGNPIGFVLLGCIVVHWVLYLNRQAKEPK